MKVTLLTLSLIVRVTNVSSGIIYQVVSDFLIYWNVSIDASLSSVASMLSNYKLIILVPILFTLYKIIGSDLNSLNHTSRSIVLIYSLNQQQLACTGIYMYLDSANISLYIKVSSNNYTIHYGIFVKISSFKSVYNCFVSTSMVWESHLLINYIIRMTQSVMSDTTGE